jgi:hypothetical protein
LRRFSLLRSTPSTVIFKTVELDEPLDSISNPQFYLRSSPPRSVKVVGRKKQIIQFAPVVTSVKHTLDDVASPRGRDRRAGLKRQAATAAYCFLTYEYEKAIGAVQSTMSYLGYEGRDFFDASYQTNQEVWEGEEYEEPGGTGNKRQRTEGPVGPQAATVTTIAGR